MTATASFLKFITSGDYTTAGQNGYPVFGKKLAGYRFSTTTRPCAFKYTRYLFSSLHVAA